MFMSTLMKCISIVSHHLIGRSLWTEQILHHPLQCTRDVVVDVSTQCHPSVSLVFQLSLGEAGKVQEIKRGLGTTN